MVWYCFVDRRCVDDKSMIVSSIFQLHAVMLSLVLDAVWGQTLFSHLRGKLLIFQPSYHSASRARILDRNDFAGSFKVLKSPRVFGRISACSSLHCNVEPLLAFVVLFTFFYHFCSVILYSNKFCLIQYGPHICEVCVCLSFSAQSFFKSSNIMIGRQSFLVWKISDMVVKVLAFPSLHFQTDSFVWTLGKDHSDNEFEMIKIYCECYFLQN